LLLLLQVLGLEAALLLLLELQLQLLLLPLVVLLLQLLRQCVGLRLCLCLRVHVGHGLGRAPYDPGRCGRGLLAPRLCVVRWHRRHGRHPPVLPVLLRDPGVRVRRHAPHALRLWVGLLRRPPAWRLAEVVCCPLLRPLPLALRPAMVL